MAVGQNWPSDEFHRLRTQAAQARVRAIRSQIALGFTFCNVAELELQAAHSGQVHKVIEKLRKLASTVDRHLNEPDHVPSHEVEAIRSELGQLESRIRGLEERAQSNR